MARVKVIKPPPPPKPMVQVQLTMNEEEARLLTKIVAECCGYGDLSVHLYQTLLSIRY